jgi:hypothetical protein
VTRLELAGGEPSARVVLAARTSGTFPPLQVHSSATLTIWNDLSRPEKPWTLAGRMKAAGPVARAGPENPGVH